MSKAGMSVGRAPAAADEVRPSTDVRPSRGGGDVVFDIETRTWKVIDDESGHALGPVRTRTLTTPVGNGRHLMAGSPASSGAQKSRSGTLTKGGRVRPGTRESMDSGSGGSSRHRVRGVMSGDMEGDSKLSWGGRMKKRMGL